MIYWKQFGNLSGTIYLLRGKFVEIPHKNKTVYICAAPDDGLKPTHVLSSQIALYTRKPVNREHPCNLKGAGLWIFWEKILSANLMETIYVSDVGRMKRKKYFDSETKNIAPPPSSSYGFFLSPIFFRYATQQKFVLCDKLSRHFFSTKQYFFKAQTVTYSMSSINGTKPCWRSVWTLNL